MYERGQLLLRRGIERWKCGKGGGSCTKAPVAALVLVRLLLVLLPGERPVLAGVLLLLMLLVASPWLPPWACFCEQLAEAGTLAVWH